MKYYYFPLSFQVSFGQGRFVLKLQELQQHALEAVKDCDAKPSRPSSNLRLLLLTPHIQSGRREVTN